MRPLDVSTLAVAAAALGLTHASLAQCMYSVQTIESPVCPETTKPQIDGLSNRGHVCGSYTPCPGGPNRAWFWSPETGFWDLGLGSWSYANDLNEDDQVAGSLLIASHYHPYRWHLGEMDVLDRLPPFPPPDDGTAPTVGVGASIDAGGDVVGPWGNAATFFVDSFRWQPGRSFEAIPELIAFGEVAATRSNPQGWICGWCSDPGQYNMRAFVLDDSGLTVLPPVPGGYSSEAYGISSNGFVTGWGSYQAGPDTSYPRGFFWDGTMHDIGWGPVGLPRSWAWAANAHGQVVGEMNSGIGFLWQDGTLRKLADLVPGVSSVGLATDINDRGQIAAKTNALGGVALILTPIRTRPGDANIDCKVDARDIATVIEFWGSRYELTEMPGDLNGDLVVNGYDLAMVLGDWGDEPQDAKRK